MKEVKNFVEEECKKPTSKYGYEPLVFHFIPDGHLRYDWQYKGAILL